MNEQKKPVDLFALADEKINADTEFQSSLEGKSDEEKAQAISAKRSELVNAEYARAAEYGTNMKIRAEKAEKGSKGDEEKPETTPNKPATDEYQLTYRDNYALNQGQVHVDDVDEVVRFAQFNKITVAEALQNATMQTILKTRTEERSSAQAANKGGGKASTKKVTGTELLKNLSEGKVPEPGSPEAEELYHARRGGRK